MDLFTCIQPAGTGPYPAVCDNIYRRRYNIDCHRVDVDHGLEPSKSYHLRTGFTSSQLKATRHSMG
jgi:hypothetical protein